MASNNNNVNIEGFLHNVTSLTSSKKNNLKYINGTIQTGTSEYKDVVFYDQDPTSLTKIQGIMQEKIYVEMKNVRTTPSKKRPLESCYAFNKFSKMDQKGKSARFLFSPPAVAQYQTLKSMQDKPGELFNATIKVNHIGDFQETRNLKYREAVVSDISSKIRLRLWEKRSLDEGTCYTIENCQIKTFGNELVLSLTMDTKINEVDQFKSFGDEVELKKGQVQDVGIVMEHQCPCGKKIASDLLCGKTFKCESCEKRYMSVKAIDRYIVSMNVNISGPDGEEEIPLKFCKKILTADYDLQDLSLDELEVKILETSSVLIEFMDEIPVKITLKY